MRACGAWVSARIYRHLCGHGFVREEKIRYILFIRNDDDVILLSRVDGVCYVRARVHRYDGPAYEPGPRAQRSRRRIARDESIMASPSCINIPTHAYVERPCTPPQHHVVSRDTRQRGVAACTRLAVSAAYNIRRVRRVGVTRVYADGLERAR